MLKGIKVVELASVLAGPLVGSFCAELGAEVLKIENKLTGGDVTRSWRLEEETDMKKVSAYYHSANYGKTSVMVDLTNEQDYLVLMDHIRNADVVISNYQKKVAEKLKVDFNQCLMVNPNLIFIQLNAFSYEDPRPGYDLVMQAEAGYISMTGNDTELAKMPVAMIDILAAHQMKEALLLALLKKEKEGKGSIVHVSLYDSALSGLVNQATNYLNEGHIAKPIGTKHPNIAPYGEVIECNGKKIMLAVGSDEQFFKLCSILNISDDRFKTNVERIANRDELDKLLQNAAKLCNFEELYKKLHDEKIPFALIKDMAQVLDDEQSRPMIKANDIEGSGGRYVSNIAFKFKNSNSE